MQNQLYLYDTLGQVVRREDYALGLTERYGYDGLNRLVSHQVNDGEAVRMRYNAIGNIVNKSDVGEYMYDEDRPHALGSINAGTAGAVHYSYDANGNMVGGAGKTYEWTAANKMKRMQQGLQWAEFAFDAQRQRVTQTREDGTVTTYIGSAYEKVSHPAGKGGLVEEKHYIMTPMGRTAVRTVRSDRRVETRYMHSDGFGTVGAVSDEHGRVEKRYSYDAWGRQTKEVDLHGSDGGEMTRGYTDHEMLEDFGLIHMNARLYDPKTGRFISADRVVQDMGDSQTYNRYSYCANNPVNAYDPTGNTSEEKKKQQGGTFDWRAFLRSFENGERYDPNADVVIPMELSSGRKVYVIMASYLVESFLNSVGTAEGFSAFVAGTGAAGTLVPPTNQSDGKKIADGENGASGKKSANIGISIRADVHVQGEGGALIKMSKLTGKAVADSGTQLGPNLNLVGKDSVDEKIRYPFGFYVIAAHGGQRYLVNPETGAPLTPKMVADMLLSRPELNYAKGTPIYVAACNVASTKLGPTNFVNEIARILDVTAVGPNTTLWLQGSTGNMYIWDTLKDTNGKNILNDKGYAQPNRDSPGSWIYVTPPKK